MNPKRTADVNMSAKPANLMLLFYITKRRRNMKRIESIFHISVIMAAACLWIHVFCSPVQALESGSYRLLSVSETEKIVLVSRISDQKKFLLDAADVIITINDKPAEFKDLILFTIAQVQMDLRRIRRKGVNLDGRASEIAISNPAEKQAEGEN